jgi:hypothetical protein
VTALKTLKVVPFLNRRSVRRVQKARSFLQVHFRFRAEKEQFKPFSGVLFACHGQKV